MSGKSIQMMEPGDKRAKMKGFRSREPPTNHDILNQMAEDCSNSQNNGLHHLPKTSFSSLIKQSKKRMSHIGDKI